MNTHNGPRIGGLFEGYGGLTMGVQSVLGGRVAWHSEVDAAPSKILAHHWPDVPNHGDITGIDFTRVEPVDVLTGGFPCQDVSLAGRRAGMIRDGDSATRSGLWGHMLRAVTELRPSLVVAENVRGLLSAEADSDVEPCPWCMGDDGRSGGPHVRALGAVLADLAGVGYDAWWTGLRAADVGAPHGRFRVFIFATPQDADGAARSEWRVAAPGQAQERRTRCDTGGRGGAPAPNTQGARRGEGWPEPAGQQRRPNDLVGGAPSPDTDGVDVRVEPVNLAGSSGPAVASLHRQAAADAERRGRHGWPREEGRAEGGGTAAARSGESVGARYAAGWGPYERAIRRWESVTRPAPAPTVPGRTGDRLSPRFVEWMMGLPDGHVADVSGLSRSDQLKALGNGVVPQQAAAAVVWALRQMQGGND